MLAAFDISVSEPCDERWESMQGSAQRRSCAKCQKTVHNIAEMSPGEVVLLALKLDAGMPVCGRITRGSDGELITLRRSGPPGCARTRSAVFSAALLASFPAAAQVSVAPIGDEAVLTGQLHRPDGSAVDSGLVRVRDGFKDTLFVVDDRGRFELHVNPGTYDLTMITGPDQGDQVRSVVLHAGEQELGQVRTESARADLVEQETESTGGVLVSVVHWNWRGRLRHPVLYARSLVRRLS